MASNSGNPPGAGDAPFVPGRLISHFSGRDRQNQADGWSALWDTAEHDLWDRGKPSPALIDLLESDSSLIPRPSTSGGRRPRALVPGCGKGYDVVMLALHGYDVYGLEVSPIGVETARAYAATELAAPSDNNFSDASGREKYSATTPGPVKFVVGDFFARDWEADCVTNDQDFKGFDLIYDYTFLCALLPTMRQDWARRMSELVAPSGVLICLEFPLYKPLHLPGPPWGLREGTYLNLLAAGGDGVIEDETAAQAAAQVTTGGPFERIGYITPPRSYEVAKGTDRLSIWGLKGLENRL